jgi:hypothetical protein
MQISEEEQVISKLKGRHKGLTNTINMMFSPTKKAETQEEKKESPRPIYAGRSDKIRSQHATFQFYKDSACNPWPQEWTETWKPMYNTSAGAGKSQ